VFAQRLLCDREDCSAICSGLNAVFGFDLAKNS
jgi:hypothetical protein